MIFRVEREHVAAAIEATASFVEQAKSAQSAESAADWSLAAKNMAATLHSLIGVLATQAKGGL